MIAFACAVTDADLYRRYAEPGIRRAAEPDSEILPRASAGTVFRSYNVLLDEVADRDDLEALVLVHQDAEIVDSDLCEKLRRAFADPEVAVVGCAGAIGVRSIAWWEGSITWGGFTHRYDEWGGGDIDAMTWKPDQAPPYAHTGEVDTIDGFVMALSPWAVRELRFDESLGQIHGYDFDFCCQARAAGKKVVTADFRAIHHHSLELIRDTGGWIEAHVKVAEKWDGRLESSVPGCDWRQRALQAEAEAAAARMQLRAQDYVQEAMEQELATIRGSRSWRMTAPIRSLLRRVRRWRQPGVVTASRR
jgi:hypothetical protein